MQVSIDVETRSALDLTKVGVYRYAEHPSTDIVCMAYAIDDAEPKLWRLGEPFPDELDRWDADYRAWNANFERTMWEMAAEKYGWPGTMVEQWHCTMAEASAMSLPRKLGHCAQVLGLAEQKADPGQGFVRRMSRPRRRKPLTWWEDEERLQRLYTYCKQDVRTERAIYHALRRLGPRERRIYLLDQIINDRGIQLDVTLAENLQRLCEMAQRDADQAMFEITQVVTGVTKVADLTQWINAQGVETDSIDKAAVREMLVRDDLPPQVRTALEIRRDAGRSSVAKISTALAARSSGDRIRGTLVYHGANTGRWAARLVQPHNFPRGEVDATSYVEQVRRGDLANIPVPLTVASAMLRQMFVAAPGHTLMVGDFAQIEARVLAWLAGQEDLLDAFRAGKQIYEPMSAHIYGVPVEDITKDDPRRHVGKGTVLGCGFGMGWEKFMRQLRKQTGIVLEERVARRAIEIYRQTYPQIVSLWYELERAAMDAVRHPGEIFTAGRCQFSRRGGYLWVALPSRRPLAYADPRVEDHETPWGEVRPSVMAWSVNSVTRQWEKRSLYGGLLAENVTQACARDIMADAMLRLDDRFPVVLTVHDEIVSEVPTGRGTLEQFIEMARQTESWAEGCPIDLEAWEGDRYRK